MLRTSHHTNDYIVIQEQLGDLKENLIISPDIKKSAIGFVFYRQGQMNIKVKHRGKDQYFKKRGGVVSSFYVSPDSKVQHEVSKKEKLEKITVFMDPEKVKEIIAGEEIHFHNHMKKLIKPESSFVEGEQFAATAQMQSSMYKIFNSNYSGITQKLFLESQISELLFGYMRAIDDKKNGSSKISKSDIDKIYFVKELVTRQLENPPTLKEISRLSQLNSFKLKTGFKEVFGVPVYQYILHLRLEQAHEALLNRNLSVQEAAWEVGYKSIGSFSNAFMKKFGYRPKSLLN